MSFVGKGSQGKGDLSNIMSRFLKEVPGELRIGVRKPIFVKTRTRNSSLDWIADWETRAMAANYRCSVMAKQCCISDRHLQRYFVFRFGVPPKRWLMNLRFHLAALQAKRGANSKAISIGLGYKQLSHFCRSFKSACGMTKKEACKGNQRKNSLNVRKG